MNMFWLNRHRLDPSIQLLASQNFRFFFMFQSLWRDSKWSLLPLIPNSNAKTIRGMIKDKSRDRWKTFNHRLLCMLNGKFSCCVLFFYPFVAFVWFGSCVWISRAQFTLPLPPTSLSLSPACFAEFNARKSIKTEFTHTRKKKRSASTNHTDGRWSAVTAKQLANEHIFSPAAAYIYWSDQFFRS